MRLYFFRSTPEIPSGEMAGLGSRVARILGIDHSVFTGPVGLDPDRDSIESLLRLSDTFLERNEPVVAVVFTTEGVEDEEILGQGSEPNRGAWVKWDADTGQTVLVALHELGHIFEADHCLDEDCLMYFLFRPREGNSLDRLFCPSCRAKIANSWVYRRLAQASADRAAKKRKLPETVHGSVTGESTPQTSGMQKSSRHKEVPETRPFPDWALAEVDEDEFIGRVLEHFNIRGSK